MADLLQWSNGQTTRWIGRHSTVLLSLHLAHVRTYLQVTEKRVGLLINFNVEYLMKGVKRVVLKF